ncbi:MAG: histidine phosphatase family protein [Pseudorhodobacter sp.]
MPIYLIRHGQSEFNAAHSDGAPDPMIFDAPLTELGQAQAQAAREQAADLGIRQVICTPLTRAIQTAKIIFDGVAPITVSAGPVELLTHSCDMGRSPSVLQASFPDLGFGHLPEVWWHQGPLNPNGVPEEPEALFHARISRFRDSLAAHQPRPLAIVGHCNTCRSLAGFDMKNCEIRRYI